MSTTAQPLKDAPYVGNDQENWYSIDILVMPTSPRKFLQGSKPSISNTTETDHFEGLPSRVGVSVQLKVGNRPTEIFGRLLASSHLHGFLRSSGPCE